VCECKYLCGGECGEGLCVSVYMRVSGGVGEAVCVCVCVCVYVRCIYTDHTDRYLARFQSSAIVQ
jgi:hypothetical protein